MKKFIIENHKDSQTFAILFINTKNISSCYKEGTLKYYQTSSDGCNMWEVGKRN